MGKEKLDPYKEIRRSVPPPGFPFGKKRRYDKDKLRRGKRKVIEEELKEIKESK